MAATVLPCPGVTASSTCASMLPSLAPPRPGSAAPCSTATCSAATWPLAVLCLRPRLGDMPCYGSASKSSNRDGELGTDFMNRKRDRKELARRKPLAGSVSDISIHSGTCFFFLKRFPSARDESGAETFRLFRVKMETE
jgi:hypothetical protein